MLQSQKSFQLKKELVKRAWVHVDAKDMVLGRMAADIARVLMGKHKPDYTPHVDSGDFVVVTNAKQVHVTGFKSEQKMYYRHSQYPGGLKQRTYDQQMSLSPTLIIKKAVKGMLPKNKLQDIRLRRLKVFSGEQTKYTNVQAITK